MVKSMGMLPAKLPKTSPFIPVYSYPGHQELELALLKAYEYLINYPISRDDEQHRNLLQLASYFIEERGTVRAEGHYFDVEARARGDDGPVPEPAPRGEPRFSYYQADAKVGELQSVNGHSVRAM